MKKAISLLLALTMVFALCACGDANTSSTKDKTIKTEEQAIGRVKAGYNTSNYIALGLGFTFYSSPDYGVCSATQNEDGSWDVVLKGNMTGSLNETKTNVKKYGFELGCCPSAGSGKFHTIISQLSLYPLIVSCPKVC